MMMECMIKLTPILFISCCFLTVLCEQPNCTSVNDFGECLGNVTDFCPERIPCACKDGKPFCKCPNFRGQWENYWYMGAKCDQLWSTLDLILVAVLPGLGLALIVGVTIQVIHYCKKKSKKNVHDYREQASSLGLRPQLNPQHNPAYAFDDNLSPQLDRGQVQDNDEGMIQKKMKKVIGDNFVHLYRDTLKRNPWSPAPQRVIPGSPGFPPLQLPGRQHNFMTNEPAEDKFYIYPSRNWDSSQGAARPEENYGNKYSSTAHMKPFHSFASPAFPKSSFNQGDRQYTGYPSSGESETPFRLGRAQMKSNY